MPLAVLFGLLLTAAPLRAADPLLVAGTEKFLTDEEKALLAAVLADPRAGAEFDADARMSLPDPIILKLFLDKWRGRIAAFAEVDSRHPDLDLEKTYRNYAAMLTPPIRAYLARRVPLMPENGRNELIAYLKDINKSLADGGRLSWYTKKVAAGVMDRYRKQLREYAASPLAQQGQNQGAAATLALARWHDEARRAARDERARRLAAPKPKPAPQETPVAIAVEPVVEDSSRRVPADALDQAADAAQDGGSGRAFDGGGTASRAPAGPVVAGPDAPKKPALSRPGPRDAHALVGRVPPVPTTADESFMSGIEGQQTRTPPSILKKCVPPGTGAVILGTAGFILGGPFGSLAGAAAGAAAGHFLGKLFRR